MLTPTSTSTSTRGIGSSAAAAVGCWLGVLLVLGACKASPSTARADDAVAHPQPPAAAAAPAAASASPDEQDVLAMYDDMAAAFTSHPGDCGVMAAAVDTAITRHQPALERLQAEQSRLSVDAYRAAHAHLEQLEGPRLESLRHVIQNAVGACGRDMRLLTSLSHLAKLTAPPR